jgi:hypothetical protein
MGWIRIDDAALACLAALAFAAGAAQAVVPAVAEVDFQGQAVSSEARRVAQWAADTGDAQRKPYAVVDKKDARLFVFAADGRLIGAAPALLGSAQGDLSALGPREPGALLPHERTTPAGRFESQPGRNLQAEAVVWVAYDEAVAIHRLRPAPAAERRPQRLASPTPDDNRITLGCIVVNEDFYDQVVAPTLGRQRGVVYVLPDAPGDFVRELSRADAL